MISKHIERFLKPLPLTAILILTSTSLKAGEIEMAETMRQSGKIYVVIAVIAVIFIGLAAYLYSLDRRISKIERKSNDELEN